MLLGSLGADKDDSGQKIGGTDDDGDYICIMMKCLSVCVSRKMSTSSLEILVTTLYNSRLVLMVPDGFFMVPCRFL